MKIKHNIVVIGGGPAGMAAAVAAFDNGEQDVIIIDREDEVGGVLRQCIHNGVGLHKFNEELTGPEYANIYKEAVIKRGIKIYTDTTVISIGEDKTVVAQNKQGILEIKAKAVVLAMGSRERSRGALNICGGRPAGVYSAGTAQRLINCYGLTVGKRAVILGSGDIGLIMARRLTLNGTKVEAVCEIMPYSSGLIRNIVQCLEDFEIPLLLSTTVVKIHGNKRLEGVTVAKVGADFRPIESTERYIACDTLLLSVGLIPENELSSMAGVKIDNKIGGAVVDQNRETSVSGIFACGNVLHIHDLVDYVSDEAEIAGKNAALYVKQEYKGGQYVDVVGGSGIHYVIPQRVNVCNLKDLTLYLRVDKPLRSIEIEVLIGDKAIAEKSVERAMPGEMIRIWIDESKVKNIDGDITVKVRQK